MRGIRSRKGVGEPDRLVRTVASRVLRIAREADAPLDLVLQPPAHVVQRVAKVEAHAFGHRLVVPKVPRK